MDADGSVHNVQGLCSRSVTLPVVPVVYNLSSFLPSRACSRLSLLVRHIVRAVFRAMSIFMIVGLAHFLILIFKCRLLQVLIRFCDANTGGTMTILHRL